MIFNMKNILVFSLIFVTCPISANAQNYYDGQYHYQPKAVVDALSKVCGNLWTLHDMGIGLSIKAAKDNNAEGVTKARDIIDESNREALTYDCPRRSKKLTEKSANATIKLVVESSYDLDAYGLDQALKTVAQAEQDYREALANE
jgi:hypothetical protein